MTDAARFAATWHDGRTARARPVFVRVDAGGVSIRDAGDRELARWPAAEVRLADRRPGTALHLRRGEADPARLTIADAAALTALLRHCPALDRRPGRLREHWRGVALWGGGAIAAVAVLLLVGIPWLAGVAARAVPPAVEVAWGAEIVEPMAKLVSRFMGGGPEPRFCATPAGRAALDRLVGRLVAGRALPVAPTVRVLEASAVNAIALPGGQILVLSGLLDGAVDAGEVAGVLAHEIGHVEARHPLQGAFKSVGTAALLGFVVGDITGGTLLVAGAQGLLQTAYARDAERAADAAAVAMLNAADIDARPLLGFFARHLAAGDAAAAASLFSTHPPSAERVAAIRAGATGRGPAMSDADWQALRGMCGSSPGDGVDSGR